MSDPFKQISSRRLPPLPGNNSSISFRRPGRISSACTAADGHMDITEGVSPDLVKTYLATHHDVLEEFIMEFVHTGDLENWLHRKQSNCTSVIGINRFPVSRAPVLQPKYLETDVAKLQRDIDEILRDDSSDRMPSMFELLNVLGCVLHADGCSLFVPKQSQKELHLYIPSQGESGYQLRRCRSIGYGETVVGYVAETLEAVLVSDLLEASLDERFPLGIGNEDSIAHSVLCVPVTLPSKDLICVMEFTRNTEGNPFDEKDLQSAVAMVSWTGSVLHQFQVNRTLQTQTELNEFLLGVSKIIFGDIVAMDALVTRIMTYAKKLVLADRCALFLVDGRHQELYSDLFDEGQEENGMPVFTKKQEIRFPICKGIAGLVARTGEVVNIPDAYSDPRFNREIDLRTGYTTRTILCMPIISKGSVIGVVQMINKRNGAVFTHADENSFNTFAVFCALALHYSKIYGEIQLRTAQYKVALEQMSYHSRCSPEEQERLQAKPFLDTEDLPQNLDSFNYYGPERHENILAELFIEMIYRTCGPNCFDLGKLCTFILTIRKNYRPVAYHNWKHAFNVAHCMFCILIRVKNKHLTTLKMKALLIACLCHDIDHRGYNNTYFTAFSEPLSQLYSTSVMEEHHYAHTVTILQQDGHDLFENLSKEDYKLVFEWIRQAILATDLALYFNNQKSLSKMVLTGTFDVDNTEHFEMAVSLMMTAADICAVCKPWHIQHMTVHLIYKEFHDQGDIEKEKGMQPIPMMDRERKGHLASDQVNFIQFVCIPCYQLLADIFPDTQPLLDGCQGNLSQWKRVIDGKTTSMWLPQKSVVTEDESDEANEGPDG